MGLPVLKGGEAEEPYFAGCLHGSCLSDTKKTITCRGDPNHVIVLLYALRTGLCLSLAWSPYSLKLPITPPNVMVSALTLMRLQFGLL